MKAGEWYARNFIYGKAHHRYSLDTYIAKVQGLYETMLSRSSLESPYIISALILCAAGLLFAWYVRRRDQLPAITRPLVLAVILADLYVFSLYGTGFRGNLRDFDHLEPERGELLHVLRNDRGRFRILPFDLASGRLPNWSRPNLNAVFGLDSIAAYSPLVTEDYHKALKGLECVDSSLGLISPSPDALFEKRELLRAMNVKYVVSARELDMDMLTERAREGDVRLYELSGCRHRAFTTAEGEVEIAEYSDGYIILRAVMDEAGPVILSEYLFPGWTARVDGRPVPVKPYMDILMRIDLPAGEHDISFTFKPYRGER